MLIVQGGRDIQVGEVDARALKVDRNIPIRVPGLERFRGVMPIGLALHPRNGWLLVAESGINAIGVIEIQTGRVLGHIPSAWFPTRVLTDRHIVYTANAKGFGSQDRLMSGDVTGTAFGQ